MKRFFAFVLILSVMTLAACRSAELPTTIGAAVGGTTTVSVTTTQPTQPTDPQPTDPQPTDPQPTEPNQEELAKFNALFGDLDSWYNKALTCEYAAPEQLDLMTFFHGAFREDSNQVTDSEIAQLKALYEHNPDYAADIENYDITRLPVDRMNQVLRDYFGITLEAVDTAGFEELDYLESTNCYYIIGGGASAAMDFNALSVENMEDGSILVYYTADWESTMRCVTLMPRGDGYQIISNIWME